MAKNAKIMMRREASDKATEDANATQNQIKYYNLV